MPLVENVTAVVCNEGVIGLVHNAPRLVVRKAVIETIKLNGTASNVAGHISGGPDLSTIAGSKVEHGMIIDLLVFSKAESLRLALEAIIDGVESLNDVPGTLQLFGVDG